MSITIIIQTHQFMLSYEIEYKMIKENYKTNTIMYWNLELSNPLLKSVESFFFSSEDIIKYMLLGISEFRMLIVTKLTRFHICFHKLTRKSENVPIPAKSLCILL